jgi:hypothetical protein
MHGLQLGSLLFHYSSDAPIEEHSQPTCITLRDCLAYDGRHGKFSGIWIAL